VRRWSGPTEELHDALTKLVGKEIVASAKWPKTTGAFSKELRRISCWLRTRGLSLSFEKTSVLGIVTIVTDDQPQQSLLREDPPSAPLRGIVDTEGRRRRRAEVRFR
jgi:hypothetical protein